MRQKCELKNLKLFLTSTTKSNNVITLYNIFFFVINTFINLYNKMCVINILTLCNKYKYCLFSV